MAYVFYKHMLSLTIIQANSGRKSIQNAEEFYIAFLYEAI